MGRLRARDDGAQDMRGGAAAQGVRTPLDYRSRRRPNNKDAENGAKPVCFRLNYLR